MHVQEILKHEIILFKFEYVFANRFIPKKKVRFIQ